MIKDYISKTEFPERIKKLDSYEYLATLDGLSELLDAAMDWDDIEFALKNLFEERT